MPIYCHILPNKPNFMGIVVCYLFVNFEKYALKAILIVKYWIL